MSLLWAYYWLSMALGLAQMVLDVRKNLKPTRFYMLNNFCFNNFPKLLIPGVVRAQVLQEPVGASHNDLDLTQMVLAVRKKLESTHLNIPNNFCFNNFAQKSIPGVVLAHGLLLAVYGPGLGQDGPGGLEKP